MVDESTKVEARNLAVKGKKEHLSWIICKLLIHISTILSSRPENTVWTSSCCWCTTHWDSACHQWEKASDVINVLSNWLRDVGNNRRDYVLRDVSLSFITSFLWHPAVWSSALSSLLFQKSTDWAASLFLRLVCVDCSVSYVTGCLHTMLLSSYHAAVRQSVPRHVYLALKASHILSKVVVWKATAAVCVKALCSEVVDGCWLAMGPPCWQRTLNVSDLSCQVLNAREDTGHAAWLY